MELTRRNFVAASAAAGAGMVAASQAAVALADEKASASKDAPAVSWRDKPAPITDVASTEDYDLVIVGGGNGGFVAACTAVEAGARVVVLEKYSFIAMAKEAIASVGAADQADFPVDMARLIQEVDSCQAGAVDARLYKVWGEQSGEMMDWLTGVLEEQGLQVVLESASPDPSLDEHIYYPPICHNTFGAWDYDYNPDGPNYGMYGHLEALAKHFTDLGGTIAFEMPAQQLVQDADGTVTGVIAKNANDEYVQYNAAKGVILCTGGFAGNAEMVSELVPETAYCAGTSTTGDTGDGVRMAMWAGAELESDHACMIWNRAILPDDFQFGLDPMATVFLPGSQPFLHVNILGERFMNEDKPYPMSFSAGAHQPGHFSWEVWDGKYWEDIQRFDTTGCSRMSPAPSGTAANADVYDCEAMTKEHLDSYWLQPSLDSGALKKCDTLEELAAAMQLDEEATKTFLATVERYNELAEAGVDEDFGKAAYRMSTVSEPPFYAARIAGLLLCSISGILTDTRSRALKADGTTVPGLWVCGNDQGGFYPQNYPSQLIGMNMGRVCTFARIAAKDALGVK